MKIRQNVVKIIKFRLVFSFLTMYVLISKFFFRKSSETLDFFHQLSCSFSRPFCLHFLIPEVEHFRLLKNWKPTNGRAKIGPIFVTTCSNFVTNRLPINIPFHISISNIKLPLNVFYFFCHKVRFIKAMIQLHKKWLLLN